MNSRISGVVEESFHVLQGENNRKYKKEIGLEVSEYLNNLVQ